MLAIEKFLEMLSGWVWGPPLLILLCGTHLFLTFRLGFIQKHLLTAIKISFSREKEEEARPAGHRAYRGIRRIGLALVDMLLLEPVGVFAVKGGVKPWRGAEQKSVTPTCRSYP